MNRREKAVYDSQLESEAQVIRELERQYRRALRDIEDRIRLLQSDEMTQSRIYQANYQKMLKAQVEAILDKLHGDENSSIERYLQGSYTDGYVGAMYAMGGNGIHVITPIDRNAAHKAIITDSELSVNLYAALGYDMTKLKKSVREEITRGIATALPYDQIARNISDYTSMPLSNAKRIVRTEGHRIQQASADDARHAAKARGADVVKQWDASLDKATRPLHRELDGQIREVDEPFEAGGRKVMYPGKFGSPDQDCNCRCVALTRARWALDEGELDTLRERAAFFGLDKEKDFAEYRAKYLRAAEIERIYPKMQRIRKSREYAVDSRIIESRRYADKFDRMTDDKQTRREYLKAAKEMLRHRSGQNGEDLYLYNRETRRWTKSTSGKIAGTPEYTQAIKDTITKAKKGTLVAFHNHPASMPPSDMDLICALHYGYDTGYVLCHDGTIFEYTAPKREIPRAIYTPKVANFKKKGYNEFDAQIKALQALAEEYGFSFREVK